MNKKEWIIGEIDFLSKNYNALTHSEIGKIINKPIGTPQAKAKRLNLLKPHKVRRWSTEEDKFLKENYKLLPSIEIANLLNRTLASIYLRLQNKGLQRVKEINWSEEETKNLLNNYKTLSYSEIGNKLNRSFKSVATKARSLGISRKHLRSDNYRRYIKERMEHDIENNPEKYRLFKSGENHISKTHPDVNRKSSESLIKFHQNLKKTGYTYDHPKYFQKGDIRISGKNNAHWNGGIRCRILYPWEYIKIRPKIFERDKWVCAICIKGESRNLTIHHIDHNRHNNADINLITLCRSCNSRESHEREKWEEVLKLISFNRSVWENPNF